MRVSGSGCELLSANPAASAPDVYSLSEGRAVLHGPYFEDPSVFINYEFDCSLIVNDNDVSGQTLPTAQEIAESIGTGFFVAFPLIALVWGARKIIGMFQSHH